MLNVLRRIDSVTVMLSGLCPPRNLPASWPCRSGLNAPQSNGTIPLRRYYTAMRLRRCAILLSMATLASASCHPRIPSAGPMEEVPGEISINVVNRNRIDVMVYLSHDGIRNRLGLATASTTTEFTVPLRTLGAGREYRLIGDPLGVRVVITTETLFARTGDEVTWQLEDNFSRSSVVVH